MAAARARRAELELEADVAVIDALAILDPEAYEVTMKRLRAALEAARARRATGVQR